MNRLTGVVVRGSNPTFMNTHSDFVNIQKKFDLMGHCDVEYSFWPAVCTQ